MTHKEFVSSWHKIADNRPSHIRKGQSLMNYLSEVWKVEYQLMVAGDYYSGQKLDCFYDDALIPNVLRHLEKVWFEFGN